MQLITKFNGEFRFNIVSKYVWVFPIRDKTVLRLLMFFKKS